MHFAFGSVREFSLGNPLGQCRYVDCIMQSSSAKIQRDSLGLYIPIYS